MLLKKLPQPRSLVSFTSPNSKCKHSKGILEFILLRLCNPSSKNLQPSPILTLNSLRLVLLLSISQPESLTSFFSEIIHSTFSSFFNVLNTSETSLIPLMLWIFSDSGISISSSIVSFTFSNYCYPVVCLLSFFLFEGYFLFGASPRRLFSLITRENVWSSVNFLRFTEKSVSAELLNSLWGGIKSVKFLILFESWKWVISATIGETTKG